MALTAALAKTCLRSPAQREPSGVRFSVMLWAIAKAGPFERCIEIVAQAGYQGVELVGEFHNWSSAERSRILVRLRSLGLVIDAMSGVEAGFAVPQDRNTFRTQFTDHLRSAGEVGCKRVILLSGRRVDGLAAETQRQEAIENLRWAAELASRSEVEIVIEPIDLIENPTIYLSTVTEAFSLVQFVRAPNLKVLYDLYHEQRSYGNLIEKLEKNIGLVGLIHVADVPGRHEPGTGEIDFDIIYRRLGKLGYDGWIAMEFYPTAAPVESLRKARSEAQRALIV